MQISSLLKFSLEQKQISVYLCHFKDHCQNNIFDEILCKIASKNSTYYKVLEINKLIQVETITV